MNPLAASFHAQACNNAWSNLRLLRACAQLSDADFTAPRTSFFPSIKSTYNHIVTVDWYYVDALERSVDGKPVNADGPKFFDPEEPFDTCAPLAAAQREIDQRLIALCARLDDPLRDVAIQRRKHVQHESAARVLAHLFQHQIHHRGQVHAMLSGTPVKPPQLDEFFMVDEAPLRAEEMAALGLDERNVWPAT